MTFELRSERRNQGQMDPGREGKLRGGKSLRVVGRAARRPMWLDRHSKWEVERGEVRGVSDKTSQATRRTLVFLLGIARSMGGP